MRTITLYRIVSGATFLLFLSSLLVPVVSITVTPSNPDDPIYLQFICVYCQFGNVDSAGGGVVTVLNLTPFDFYNTWVINIILIMISLIPLTAGYPQIGYSFITPKRAVISSWVLVIMGLALRGLLSILLVDKLNYYRRLYPTNQILGDLSWSMGGVTIGAIMAATMGMLGYIMWLYDSDGNVKNAKVKYYEKGYGSESEVEN